MIKKSEHKNPKQKHEMCKTDMKTNVYHVNICKNEYEKNMKRLWCKIVLKIGVE